MGRFSAAAYSVDFKTGFIAIICDTTLPTDLQKSDLRYSIVRYEKEADGSLTHFDGILRVRAKDVEAVLNGMNDEGRVSENKDVPLSEEAKKMLPGVSRVIEWKKLDRPVIGLHGHRPSAFTPA